MERYYWLNEASRKFLSKDYLKSGQSAENRIGEIAKRAETLLGIKGFAQKFEGYMALGYYSLSTPVWTNFGSERGYPVSCFSSYFSDNIESILEKTAEVGTMSKVGGGTSGYLGEIRPRGSKISVGGKADGPVRFLELIDKTTEIISQGSTRRGAFAAYLPVEHDDILDFLKIREEGHAIKEMNIAVTITDKWMEEMIGGDKDKRNIWGRIIQKRCETGYPYITFIDNANNNKPKVYKDKGNKIYNSNLCVAPETLLLTRDGYKVISTLEGCEVEVWNGKQWSATTVVKTGENQSLIKVILTDGKSLDCTRYHKFHVRLSSTTFESVEKMAADLKNGDILISNGCEPIIDFFERHPMVVEDVVDFHRKDDTYCVNEPLEHKAVFNGILTGNCNEIYLPSSPEESFVCVLSSINLVHWDEIIKTDAIETMIYFLDAVNEEFVQKTATKKFMEAPHRFAKNHRALGLGVLGWHSYLQKNMIAFESLEAKMANTRIFRELRKKTDKATEELAKLLGEPEMLKGYGRRNTTTIAIAPTTSSSFILGQVSPGIEPENSVYFVKNLAKMNDSHKNPYFSSLLDSKGKNTFEVWESVLHHGGSVQHLDFLSEQEKDVFKTFGEISQKEIVIQAAARQKFIDQGQSLNLMIPPSAKPKAISDLHIEGWKMGIKGFYYQRSSNPAQMLVRDILTCKSCEG